MLDRRANGRATSAGTQLNVARNRRVDRDAIAAKISLQQRSRRTSRDFAAQSKGSVAADAATIRLAVAVPRVTRGGGPNTGEVHAHHTCVGTIMLRHVKSYTP